MLGSKDDDVILLEEPGENVHVKIRHTKDFRFVTVNVFSTTYSKVFLIDAADPLSGMTVVWECEACAHCIIEHHHGYLYLFTNADRVGQSVDYHYLLRSPLHTSGPRKWEVSLVHLFEYEAFCYFIFLFSVTFTFCRMCLSMTKT